MNTMSCAKEIKRQKLLDQGVAMLMTQGYHGTGLKQLLESVKVPKGSFYHYFDSKESFAVAAIEHYIEPFIQRLNQHLHDNEQDALAALKHYFQELIVELEQAGFQGGCLLGNLMGELGDNSPACQKALKRVVNRYRDLQRRALQKAQQQGSVRTDLDAEYMADLLTNHWQGALLRMKIEQSAKPLEECCRFLLEDYFIR
ncbi:TetR/AcrR family transcriptional regulator [methane-oxidizing endosymbiont of Gigantopelta aegis]|uniref:TetR/AcrR family transcriptional regulator n=1 Tax=methane-oxidizing endosymbiont of Gigantopelta aegis TaxID=2794938 RepID=UPI0018DAF7B8|nr:TetR/AcrR family transcriptional regulator [methane-oxidizing endosymbiont of Gigantopelta aegis]